ncbi:MAG: hypothetical protein JXN62_01140 [Bacteroidales bacterium]|nr:hypothetical protein [Bacteroidales bacterium]
MEKPKLQFNTGRLIFTAGLILSLSALFITGHQIILWGTLLISLIFLGMGWYFFRAYYPQGNTPLLFLMGYLYASVFIAVVFSASHWPMTDILIIYALICSILQSVIILSLRKKLIRKTFSQFIIEAGILLILSIFMLSTINKI